MPRVRPVVAAVILAVCAAAAPVRARALPFVHNEEVRRPVPEPALGRFEEAVRLQLEEERSRLESAVRAASSAEELAAAYGRLGQVYFVYELTEPARICFLNARDALPTQPVWHLYLALVYQREGELELAAAELEAILELDSDDAPAITRLGDVSLDLGRLETAEQAYRRALGLDASSAPAVYGLARLAALDGRLEEARGLFERALDLQPAATSIHHQLGMVHRELGDLEAARRHFELNTSGRVVIDDPRLVGLNRLVRSAKVFGEAGEAAARQGDFAEAVRQFRMAAEADPKDPVTFYHLALAEMKSGQRDSALEHLRRSIALDPDVRDARLMLGRLLTEFGRFAEAEVEYRRAHSIDPEDLESHLNWVTALTKLDRLEEARIEIGGVLERDPTNPRARLVLGILYARLGQGGLAVSELGKVIEGARSNAAEKAEAHHHMALLEESSGNMEAAETAYRSALALRPGDAERVEALALFLGRRGRFKEAGDAYERAVALDRARGSAHFGRAMAHLLAERYVEAKAGLDDSMAERPGDVGLADLMARVLVAAPDEAVRDPGRGYDLAVEVHRREPSPERAQTVAMALAELGRFEEAVEWQRAVLGRLERSADPRTLAQAQGRLELYLEGRPCRAPWLEPAR